MGRWGLRWVFCWLSVLVTACSQLASPTPAPKTQNRTPLEGFTPPPTASPTEPLRPSYTLTPFGTMTRPLSDVALEDPVCYESLVQSLICLGWVQNVGTTPLTDLLINIYLLSAQGFPLATIQATSPLAIVYPDTGVPYRAVFSQIPNEAWAVYADLQNARIAEDSRLPEFPLKVVNLQTIWHEAAYEVSGQLLNEANITASQARIVIAIRGSNRSITGFRVLDLLTENELLKPDERLPFDLQVAPLNQQEGEEVLIVAQGFTLN